MALELSCLDMELLLSFSTPVDSTKEGMTATVTTAQAQQANPTTQIQVDNPAQKPPTNDPQEVKESVSTQDNQLVSVSASSELVENSKIIPVDLTDKNGEKYSTSYKAEVVFTRDDFSKKKDNYKVKGSVTIYKCQQCPYQNPKIQSIKEHQVNHRKYPNSIRCRYCEYYAPYGLSLQQHEVLHNDYTPSERGFKSEKEKKKFCPECPYKAVKNREIKCHQLNHVYREGYLKCRYCNYFLINTKGMKQHEVLHANDKTYTVNAIGQSPRQQRKQVAEASIPSEPPSEQHLQQPQRLQQQQQPATPQPQIQHIQPANSHQIQLQQQSQFQQPRPIQLTQVQHPQIQHQMHPLQHQQIFHQHQPQQQHQQQPQIYQAYQQQYHPSQVTATPVYQQIIPQSNMQAPQMVLISPEMYAPVQSSNLAQLVVPGTNQQIQQQQLTNSNQQIQAQSIPALSVSHLNHITPTTTSNNPITDINGHIQRKTLEPSQPLSRNELSILSQSLKEKEVTEKLETINISDKTGQEFSITYVVKKISTASNKYREKGSSTIYCCQLCPYTTKFSTHLREHLPHHKQYTKSVKCRYCNYYASNTLNLKQHEILHPNYEVSLPKRTLTKKEKDSPTTFKNERKRKRYKCKVCPFDGQHPYLIVRHMKYHVYKDGFVKCRHCDYFLATSNNMKQHEVLHQVHEMKEAQIQKEMKRKKHACKICPFKTIQKSHLERHSTFHNRDNFNPKKGYYTCEYCKYYSTNTGKLKQHEVLHTQEWEALIEEVATADVESGDCDSEDGMDENDHEGVDLVEAADKSPGSKDGETKPADESADIIIAGEEAGDAGAVVVSSNEPKQESVEMKTEAEVNQ